MLSDSDGQGKAFGIFEGGRGIAAALAASVAVILFKVGVKTLGVYVGMRYIIVFYSVLTIASGVLVYFNMKDEIINSGEKYQ